MTPTLTMTHPNHDPETVEKHLATREAQPLAVQQREPSTGELLAAIIQQGISPQAIEVMERMLAMREREENKKAAQAFSDSLSAFQSDMPTLVAQTEIPKRGKYERFEDIMHVARPLLVKHGFSVSFRQETAPDKITAICRLSHRAGHFTENSFSVRPSNKADTPTQSDCMASTTTKRNALIQALNIIIRQDCLDDENDARIIGGNITPEQAQDIYRRVMATGSDAKKFLEFAGAATFEEIGTAALPRVEKMLAAKERAAQK